MLNVSGKSRAVQSGSVIYVSHSYEMFKIHPANRDVDSTNIATIEDGMKKKFLLSSFPIVVNKDFEIMDGQTRFYAAKNLNKPIFYIVDPDIEIGDVAQLNFTRRWKKTDVIKMKAYLGDAIAIDLQRRIKYAKGMGYSAGSALVASQTDERLAANNSRINEYGEFIDIMIKINNIIKAFNVARGTRLANALVPIVSHPLYIETRMLKMIAKHGKHFAPFGTAKENQLYMEQIYNHDVAFDEDYVKLTLKARPK